MREEYQAICLGAKVGSQQPSPEKANHQVWVVGMILFPDRPEKRRAFEELCQICPVVQQSYTAGSVPVDHSMVDLSTMVSQSRPYHYEPGNQ